MKESRRPTSLPILYIHNITIFVAVALSAVPDSEHSQPKDSLL